MAADQEESRRERTGVYPNPPPVQPLSMEDAQHLLALDRPDLSLSVDFPLEWRLSRRETRPNSHIEEMAGEQGPKEAQPPSKSNANRLRSVEERCNLRVRRNVSQAELSAMGVPEWPEYSWSQPVNLGLAYDRVPEACYIEHGRVRVRPPEGMEDDFCELAAGDFIRFPKYSSFVWEIVEAPLVRRYKFLIDLPPPPDPAEVLRLRLHAKKMHEQQQRAEARYKKMPVKGREKQMRIAEAEMRKDLTELRTSVDRFSD